MKQFAKLALLLFLSSSFLFSSVDFTKDEKRWIKNNPVVKLGADYRWPPFDFIDANGEHTGLSSEYIKLISKKSGLQFKIETGVWADVLKNMQNKKYDGLTCAVETDERKKYLKFTTPYLSVPMVIIAKKELKGIENIESLYDKTVSINKGSYIHEWLRTKYPQIELHLTNSNEASLEAVSLGEAEAYVGNQAVATFIMNKNLLTNLTIVKRLQGFDTAISIAIDRDNMKLFNIIQKILNNITPQEHQAIKQKWNKNKKSQDELLAFTKEEKKWIQEHKTIRYVIDNHWRPIEYFSKETQEHQGITSEYIKIISQKIGIDFKLIHTDTWMQSVDLINKKEADMYSCVSITDERKKVIKFSNHYLKFPQVFVTTKDVNYVGNIQELYNKTIVLIDGYSITTTIEKEHPKIKIIKAKNITEAFKLLTKGEAYAYIDSLPVASYYIQKDGYSNLKISGMSNYDFKFRIALRDDWSNVGIDVINKALSSITEEQKSEIYNKWLHVKYDKEVDYTLLWQIAGVFVFFILWSLYWNAKLSSEVKKRKQAQVELLKINEKLKIATNKAEAASKAKSDFLSNMSHEIRTPMNAILGFAELLDTQIEDKKQKSFIKTIRNAGETLLFLINDILDLSKIESGKLEIVKHRVNIKELLEESINIFKLQAEQKGLKLELILDENIPKSLLLDSFRVKEIIINLIGNAIKFTEDGYIKLIVLVDDIYEHKSKIDLTLKIKDSGIGIEKSNIEKIFNIFEQSQNQDVRKYGGTGLGLAISKKLAILMDGTLAVESKVGVGSTFILCLKNIDIASVSNEDGDSKIATNYDFVKFKKAVLLVVDDVNENRKLVRENFNNTDVEVIEAINGSEAIEMIKEIDVDLILMDIRMPVMDGYSATRFIKEFSKVPIVALSASMMQDELKKLDGGRFDGYLRKPVTKNELFKEVSRFLDYEDIISKRENNTLLEIADMKELSDFLNSTDVEVTELYEDAIKTNDLKLIEEFTKKLEELSLKYNIKHMLDYSELLQEKIDTFEINSITTMLQDYKKKIEELKSKL